MGVWQKCSRTQGSKEILREMSEERLRSLEKSFFFLFWRRNGEVKKTNQDEDEVNSVNGGRKDEGGRESKKRERERQGQWGTKIRSPHLNSASC